MSALKVDDALQAIATLQQEKAELLAALQKLASAFHSEMSVGSISDGTYYRRLIEQADAAIAKAKAK